MYEDWHGRGRTTPGVIARAKVLRESPLRPKHTTTSAGVVAKTGAVSYTLERGLPLLGEGLRQVAAHSIAARVLGEDIPMGCPPLTRRTGHKPLFPIGKRAVGGATTLGRGIRGSTTRRGSTTGNRAVRRYASTPTSIGNGDERERCSTCSRSTGLGPSQSTPCSS